MITYLIGALFTVGFLHYAAYKEKRDVKDFVLLLSMAAWPFVLGAIVAEIVYGVKK